jgi:hypothetical protein
VNASIAWAEADDADENEDTPEEQDTDADVEDLATRRLTRWLRGMFGGDSAEPKG